VFGQHMKYHSKKVYYWEHKSTQHMFHAVSSRFFPSGSTSNTSDHPISITVGQRTRGRRPTSSAPPLHSTAAVHGAHESASSAASASSAVAIAAPAFAIHAFAGLALPFLALPPALNLTPGRSFSWCTYRSRTRVSRRLRLRPRCHRSLRRCHHRHHCWRHHRQSCHFPHHRPTTPRFLR